MLSSMLVKLGQFLKKFLWGTRLEAKPHSHRMLVYFTCDGSLYTLYQEPLPLVITTHYDPFYSLEAYTVSIQEYLEDLHGIKTDSNAIVVSSKNYNFSPAMDDVLQLAFVHLNHTQIKPLTQHSKFLPMANTESSLFGAIISLEESFWKQNLQIH